MLDAYIYDGLRSPIGRHGVRWHRFVRTIWLLPSFARSSIAVLSTLQVSRTSSLAALLNPAKTVATLRATRHCWPGYRRR